MESLGVVYLYRYAEGANPARRFLKSYGEFPAGITHDFHVIFKGFPDRQSLIHAQSLFADVPINAVELADIGYDIGSYLEAAKVVGNERLIFLNTFSRILVPNWLVYFDRASRRPDVGVVGATGSWQSNTSGYERHLAARMRQIRALPGGKSKDGPRPAENLLIRKRRLRAYVVAPFRYLYCYAEFGRFPNPHIRTNAFMIERNRFLSLNFPSFTVKSDVYKFESGRRSMTKQLLSQGLSPVVVDRAGKVHEIANWKSSSTFWMNNQINLVIADNRTLDYEEGNEEFRSFLEHSAWVHPWS